MWSVNMLIETEKNSRYFGLFKLFLILKIINLKGIRAKNLLYKVCWMHFAFYFNKKIVFDRKANPISYFYLKRNQIIKDNLFYTFCPFLSLKLNDKSLPSLELSPSISVTILLLDNFLLYHSLDLRMVFFWLLSWSFLRQTSKFFSFCILVLKKL